jgi:hypothetical protein
MIGLICILNIDFRSLKIPEGWNSRRFGIQKFDNAEVPQLARLFR